MSFLPNGFEKLKTERPYWKMSQMKEGENRMRIVTQPICGWIDWKDAKPIRYRADQKPLKSADPLKPVRPFWACYVWDYAREGLYVLEITQARIQQALTNYALDEDWGDFTKYDIKIRKEGSGKETKYHVTPMPHKPMAEKTAQALEAMPVRLENLFDGGDPWDVDVTEVDAIEQVVQSSPEDATQWAINEEQIHDLLDLLTPNEKLMAHTLKKYKSLSEIPAGDFEKVYAVAKKQYEQLMQEASNGK